MPVRPRVRYRMWLLLRVWTKWSRATGCEREWAVTTSLQVDHREVDVRVNGRERHLHDGGIEDIIGCAPQTMRGPVPRRLAARLASASSRRSVVAMWRPS